MPTIKGRTQRNKKTSKKNGSRRAPARQSNSSEVLHLARLIADPCGAPLVAPQYGASDGGYLAKFSSYEALQVSTTGQNGYCLWYPDFCGRASGGTGGGNLYFFATNNVNTSPVNTTDLPLGMGATFDATNGEFVNDPAWDFCNSSTVQDCRTVAACMKMLYTGRNDSLAGRIGYLSNVPREALVSGATGGPPSPGDLFRYSNHATRTPMDPAEQKFTPGEGSDLYRMPHVDVGVENSGMDTALLLGVTGTSVTGVGNGSATGVGTGIGFVWNGLANNTSLSFDFLKAVEWRPEMNTGIVVPQATTAAGGQNIVHKAVAHLNTRYPGWERRAFQAVASQAAQIARSAWSGPMSSYIKDAAPLLLTML